MRHNSNWEHTKSLLSAWWRHEADRPLVQVTAPKKGCVSSGVFDWWAVMRPGAIPETVLQDYLRFCEDAWFGGVAFPSMFFNMGPGVLAAYNSGYSSFEPVSCASWFENPQPWEVVEQYRLQKNEWRQFTTKGMQLFSEAGKDEFIMGMTDLGGILDVLASFRGAQELALDLLMEPDQVHAARKRILKDWHHAFDRLHTIITRYQEGMSAWYPLQCDFCAMISPKQFEIYVLPNVIAKCEMPDNSIYHMDGPRQIPHLDMLLEVEALDGIQWIPGSGNPQCESAQWRPLYKKILKKNKLLALQCFHDIRALAPALEGLPKNGVLISVGADTEQEGRSLLECLEGM